MITLINRSVAKKTVGEKTDASSCLIPGKKKEAIQVLLQFFQSTIHANNCKQTTITFNL